MSARGSSAAWILAGLLVLTSSGCAFFSRPRSEFVNQEGVLEATAAAAGFEPDGGSYRLVLAEVSRDSIIFQYLGVERPGDQAWAIRFAQKSSEQKPQDLASLDGLLGALRKGKEGFQVVERARRTSRGGLSVDFARYHCSSILRGKGGEPLQAAGAAAIVRIEEEPAPVIYQFNVESIGGERRDLGWKELEPLVEAIPR